MAPIVFAAVLHRSDVATSSPPRGHMSIFVIGEIMVNRCAPSIIQKSHFRQILKCNHSFRAANLAL
jgi:hypothetical protein